MIAALIDRRRDNPGDDIFSRVCLLEGDDGKRLSTQDILDNIIFLMTAAHDTLASAFTSAVYFLASYPEIADNVRSEIRAADIGPSIEAGTANLWYMDAVFKEALRLNGPAPVIWRRAIQDFEIYGHKVPAGTITGVNLMLAHRMPDIWPDPLKFDPNRFTPAAERALPAHAFVPFSGGVHKCLGLHFSNQQARIFITELLRETSLTLVNAEPVEWYHWPNCRPASRLCVRVG